MSFGQKKKEKQVTSSLQANNFYSPFGTVTSGRNSISFNPTENSDQTTARDVTDSKLLQTLQQVPSSYNVDDAFNNRFYTQLSKAYQQPIDYQKSQDERELNNRLSAQNQIGSSYDALQRDYLGRRYDQRYADAENQARLTSADAYNQSFNNNLMALAALRNDRNAGLEATYSPLKYALNYQSALNPLATAQASFYANQPSAYQQALGNINGAVNTARNIRGYYFGY